MPEQAAFTITPEMIDAAATALLLSGYRDSYDEVSAIEAATAVLEAVALSMASPTHNIRG